MSGSKIKDMGKTLSSFIIGISIPAGVVVGVAFYMMEMTVVGIVLGAIVLVCGVVSGWSVGLLIAGFGEVVADVRIIREAYVKNSTPISDNSIPKSDDESPSIIPTKVSETHIKCPSCENTQHSARDFYCVNCGVIFKRKSRDGAR